MNEHRVWIVGVIASAMVACGGAAAPAAGPTPSAPSTSTAAAATTSAPTPSAPATTPSTPDAPSTAAAGTTAPPAEPPAPKAATAGYRWEVHTPTGMEFEVPTDWTKRVEGDVLLIVSPTPGAAIEFVGVAGRVSAAHEEREILGALGRSLEGAKLTGRVEPVSQHGLRGWMAPGEGRKNGKDIRFLTSGVGDGNGHELLATALFDVGIAMPVKQQMVHVLNSIQSTNK